MWTVSWWVALPSNPPSRSGGRKLKVVVETSVFLSGGWFHPSPVTSYSWKKNNPLIGVSLAFISYNPIWETHVFFGKIFYPLISSTFFIVYGEWFWWCFFSGGSKSTFSPLVFGCLGWKLEGCCFLLFSLLWSLEVFGGGGGRFLRHPKSFRNHPNSSWEGVKWTPQSLLRRCLGVQVPNLERCLDV